VWIASSNSAKNVCRNRVARMPSSQLREKQPLVAGGGRLEEPLDQSASLNVDATSATKML
jgi:hypothetical protein